MHELVAPPPSPPNSPGRMGWEGYSMGHRDQRSPHQMSATHREWRRVGKSTQRRRNFNYIYMTTVCERMYMRRRHRFLVRKKKENTGPQAMKFQEGMPAILVERQPHNSHMS